MLVGGLENSGADTPLQRPHSDRPWRELQSCVVENQTRVSVYRVFVLPGARAQVRTHRDDQEPALGWQGEARQAVSGAGSLWGTVRAEQHSHSHVPF